MYHSRLPQDERRYAYLSAGELVARLQEKAILYLPIGSLEWHNEHLPLGTDTFHAFELAMRLSAELGGVVLPPFWWNTGWCYDHASTYHMPEELYRATLKNVCLGLTPLPARLLVLINGHGGDYQRETPAAVAAELNAGARAMRVVAADPYALGQSSACRIDHADTGETSLSLELIPQLVRLEREVGPDLVTGRIPFAGGPPTRAGGGELWRAFRADARDLIEAEYALATDAPASLERKGNAP